MSRRAADPAIQTSPVPAVALDALFPVVYAELRRIAHRRLRSEAAGHTLSTTALVHETYLKLAEQRLEGFGNRAHFFALAARAMRRILVDYARRHGARKRPDPRQRLSLASLEDSGLQAGQARAAEVAERAELLLAVDLALEQLGAVDERLARVVEYRFFVGLTEPETAELLGVTPRTVTRDWVRARAWLLTHLDARR